MTSKTFSFGTDDLTPEILVHLASAPRPDVTLSAKQRAHVQKFRDVVDKKLASGETIYGINTGFGYLSDVKIPNDKLSELQLNLVRSHACGVGDDASPEHVRGLLILRAHTFAIGHSGVRTVVIDRICDFLKHDILPCVPVQGSVGASGDLAPLAHLAMGLLGEGEVFYKGKKTDASEALKDCGLQAFGLEPKEGLALINGTQFMTVLGAFALQSATKLLKAADISCALSLDALRGTLMAFDARIHAVRKQPGQRISAANITKLLSDDNPIRNSHKDCGKVQDPYSFRCAPQVHGAARDVIGFAYGVVAGELNSVSDNPLVFEDGSILSGGNFHGQPVAHAMDLLAIACAELGSISERRTEKLTNPAMSSQPAFLAKDGGLNSGFMIPHVVAAALVSENKILCHPASVDSIPTSADKEDHVSMGPIAARKAIRVIDHVYDILAIEALAAAQGVWLLAPLLPGKTMRGFYDGIRALSPPMATDRSLHPDIRKVSQWLKSGGAENAIKPVSIT